MPGELIEQAARYLREILLVEESVLYSRFYDGTDETRDKLIQGMRITAEDADRYGVEGVMDQAAAGLERAGYVRIVDLEEKLADDEKDYRIDLLEHGRTMFKQGRLPPFHDLDL
jgi:hypothetical protein